MTAINDIHSFKLARVLEKQILEALEVLRNSVISMEKYSHLRPIGVSISIVSDSITLLEIALETQRHIIKTKGLHVIQD